uniref:FT-interacting protein 1-like n=1 Tax=Tanacetum cinerariifolium TaxID=118510 RepID=A0A699JWG1_TANCI|nr:FT-interacting protein 1-like [Tanacetum cinerariifolium]
MMSFLLCEKSKLEHPTHCYIDIPTSSDPISYKNKNQMPDRSSDDDFTVKETNKSHLDEVKIWKAPPDSPVEPQRYGLENRKGKKLKGEAMQAVWWG